MLANRSYPNEDRVKAAYGILGRSTAGGNVSDAGAGAAHAVGCAVRDEDLPRALDDFPRAAKARRNDEAMAGAQGFALPSSSVITDVPGSRSIPLRYATRQQPGVLSQMPVEKRPHEP